MKKLFIHVGFAKCGSTSLQDFLKTQSEILYPKSGINGAEHLSLPLKIKGVDEWTRQYYQEPWVDANHEAMIAEIRETDYQTILISSERIASFSVMQIAELKEIFRDYDVEIIFVERSVKSYINSTWRHAVFWHDYAESWEFFQDFQKNYSFGNAVEKFKDFFPVHVFNMESPTYESELSSLIGVKVELGHSNVGVSQEFAEFLQSTHRRVGSAAFKKVFTHQAKVTLRNAFNSKDEKQIEPILAKLF